MVFKLTHNLCFALPQLNNKHGFLFYYYSYAVVFEVYLHCFYDFLVQKTLQVAKKRQLKKKESPALTRQLVFEILSRATSKDIGRCRLISKYWNLLTYDTSFMQEHSKKTKTISGFFIQVTKESLFPS